MHTKKELQLLKNELERLLRQEEKLLSRKGSGQGGSVTGAIRKKIPEKAMNALENAFQKGFGFLFEKGDRLIEKTGSLEKARRQWIVYKDSLDRMIIPQTLKALDSSASIRAGSGKNFTALEGTAMGIFGIGLPGIPVFLAVLLKVCYEIAAAYGIDYRKEEERRYTLYLLRVVFSSGALRKNYSEECDELGIEIDDNLLPDTDITDEEIAAVSRVLAGDMLVARFLQGLTFFGVIGGPLNYLIINKVSRIAKIKYKKRFLYRFLAECAQ